MTTISAASRRLPLSGVAAALLVATIGSWVVTITWIEAGDMGVMPGTMGMSVFSFTTMWGSMMAAMMLPSVAPFVQTYAATVTEDRPVRLTALASGYLLVWTLVGLVAFVVADRFDAIAGGDETTAVIVAGTIFAAVGVYQLTPLKFRCLSHCRSPLGHLMHYLGFTGRTRDLRAGAAHGLFCLGCCWALMVLMVAFGVMNIAAMIGLAAVIAVEKTWRHGETFARLVGAACLVYAVAVVVEPGLAPGLDPDAVMTPMGEMSM